MLDDNPNDTSTETGTAGSSTPGDAPAPPTVTRTTRKTAARKTATSSTRGTRKTAASADAPPAEAPPAEGPGEAAEAPVVKKTTRTRTPRKTAAAAAAAPESVDAASGSPDDAGDVPAKKATTRKSTRTRKTAAAAPTDEAAATSDAPADQPVDRAGTAAPRKTTARRSTAKKAAATEAAPDEPVVDPAAAAAPEPDEAAQPVRTARKTAKKAGSRSGGGRKAAAADEPTDVTAADADEQVEGPGAPAGGVAPLFQAPDASAVTRRTRRSPAARKAAAAASVAEAETEALDTETLDVTVDEDQTGLAADELAQDGTDQDAEGQSEESEEQAEEEAAEGNGPARRRRRRGGRRRRKGGEGSGADNDTDSEDEAQEEAEASSDDSTADTAEQGEGTSRRRRRRRRAGEEAGEESEDEPNTVTRVRSRRAAEDQITAVAGSTRLEAKKQRRREGREAGRRRAPIVSEAEFLARRESVDRTMVIRQRDDLTQIAVLEDKVLVEHYVARESQTSLIGNVYLGRVQNVLPSMEAAFIDIGRGRNAVLYAGEVNWASLGHKEGQPRKIESVLSSGQSILVQVTKDPIGHKGARLTSQVSLAGRFLVYVPDGTTSGISRKLPDTERNRLKTLLKEIVPDSAGVIVRTAAEGASEDELTRDVERLKARWEDIEAKARGNAPALLYGEPDLTLKVVRDLFTEDFNTMVIQGDDAWETVQAYVEHVAPDLVDRVEKFEAPAGASAKKSDIFAVHRIDEQIAKGLDRKVWLPSGGSLVIDRTEAMTVVDVNTGKFTGSGGNLEETVTKNNLEAAEEIVRQLRLRDIGGIIVVDFIDMVLESNRDLVVRRLVECLGRDRTRHQVAEVTSLGLVQMTRKRIGTGLLEAFSRDCEHCQGRGVVIQAEPVEAGRDGDDEPQRNGRRGRGRGRGEGSGSGNGPASTPQPSAPSPKDVAAMARADRAEEDRAEQDGLEQDRAEQDGVEQDRAAEPAGQTAGATTPDGEPAGSGEPAQDARSTGSAGRREGSRRGGRSGGRSRTASSEETSAVEPAAVENAPATSSVEPGTAVLVDAPSSTEEPEQPAQPADATPVEPTGDVLTEPAPEAPVEQEKPRVVTRTRRRAASRPAGPPVGVAGTQPASGLVEPGTSDVEHGGPAAVPDPSDTAHDPAHDEPHVEHVPIKKKGTRKR